MSNSVVFKCEFERQAKNKCSSYIDQNAKLNAIMQTSAQSKPKNYKKIKSFISHKLRKLLHHTPQHLQPKKTSITEVQLLKFDYKSNFVAMETAEIPRASRFAPRSRRHSNGTSSSSSSSSTSSLTSCNNSEQFFLLTSQQQSELNFSENFVESSTPVGPNRVVSRHELTEPIAFSYDDDCQMDQTCQLD
ncbi:hypothetical protein BpHYR1_043667, partial [Brachionus plicatilis]